MLVGDGRLIEDGIFEARHELIGLRSDSGGWGYRTGSEPCVEPTCLAALALLATQSQADPDDGGARAVQESAAWIARPQRADGALGVSETRPEPGWMTPYALLLWSALETEMDRAARATAWLLDQSGLAMPRSDDPLGIAGHDTTLVGWPWVSATHSWLEPTALSVLALGREGMGNHPRVRDGIRLIRDRAVQGGGWNYGNKAVFNRPLRAQPAPTGLALLTLAGVEKRGRMIDRAITYLKSTLITVRAPVSLGWGLLGLGAWGERPEASADWLFEAYEDVSGRPDAAMKLACLLLASSDESAGLFGRVSLPTRSK